MILLVFFIVFAKAIHCLAKIGEEIYLEPLNKGVNKNDNVYDGGNF